MASPVRPSSSREIDLLCALVRPQPDLLRAQSLLRGAIDFPVFLELAQVHAVRPRLIQALSSLDWDGVPLSAKRELEAFRESHVLRSLYLAEQQGNIADALLAAGICFAFFKGATLAADLYGDLSWREYGDIDVIVMPHQVAQAERVLEDLDYLNRQGDPAFRRAFLASQRQYSFTRADIGATVDLHWDFSAGQLPFPLRPEDAWGSLKGVRVGSRNMPTVSDENLALLLAGHGTKEAWRSLGWVCDFSIFVESAPGLDWASLLVRARRRGSGNALLLGCAMARELLGTPVPGDLVKPLASNKRVGRLVEQLVEQMWGGIATLQRPTPLMDIDLCDRRWDRVKAALSVVFTPTPGDYHARPLPAGLWWLYYLLRPLRLAAQALTPRRSPVDDRPGAGIGRPTPQHQTS
jgi:Uncharacterised nucleotidyltransferase